LTWSVTAPKKAPNGPPSSGSKIEPAVDPLPDVVGVRPPASGGSCEPGLEPRIGPVEPTPVEADGTASASGHSVHAALNQAGRPCRLPDRVLEMLDRPAGQPDSPTVYN